MQMRVFFFLITAWHLFKSLCEQERDLLGRRRLIGFLFALKSICLNYEFRQKPFLTLTFGFEFSFRYLAYIRVIIVSVVLAVIHFFVLHALIKVE